MELARPLAEPAERPGPLTALRLRRKLTVEEAARRAALWPEQAEWLEEGRLHRFPDYNTAVLALLRYATALDVDHREARRLSGLPVEPPARRSIGPLLAAGAGVALVVAGTLAFLVGVGPRSTTTPAARRHSPALAPPWKVSVDVLDGGGNIGYTRRVATRVGSFGYRIEHVTKANSFGYGRTAVYFEPGGAALARRLAGQIGAQTRPLPGGSNPRRLVVIVGPAHAAN